LKMVHLLPALFTIGVAFCLLGSLLTPYALLPLLLYALLVFGDSAIQNRSILIGLYAIAASYIQLLGYGTGFLRAWWLRCVMGRNEELQAFKKNFYQ